MQKKRELGNKTDEETSFTTSCHVIRVCHWDNDSALAQDRLSVWKGQGSAEGLKGTPEEEEEDFQIQGSAPFGRQN